MQDLKGKTLLITGGTKGIGAATSALYAQHGANVAINYASDTAAAEAHVQSIDADDRVLLIKGDAGSIADIESMVQQTVDRFGQIDVVIANAGILIMRELEDVTERDYTRMMDLNVKGPLFLVQKAVPYMPPGSRVILVSSSTTANSTVGSQYVLYDPTKGAIEQMNRSLSKGLGRKGINVNIVSPGPTTTELMIRGKSQELLKIFADQSPCKRMGNPEDVAEAFLFLGSPAARWISGQNLRANGAAVV